MKKRLLFTNETGFILPSVCFLLFLLLLIFLTNITIYELELTMSKQMIDQIKIESLIQLGVETYKNDLQSSQTFIPQTNYQFPQGIVVISASEEPIEQLIQIKMDIQMEDHEQYGVDLTIPLLNH